MRAAKWRRLLHEVFWDPGGLLRIFIFYLVIYFDKLRMRVPGWWGNMPCHATSVCYFLSCCSLSSKWMCRKVGWSCTSNPQTEGDGIMIAPVLVSLILSTQPSGSFWGRGGCTYVTGKVWRQNSRLYHLVEQWVTHQYWLWHRAFQIQHLVRIFRTGAGISGGLGSLNHLLRITYTLTWESRSSRLLVIHSQVPPWQMVAPSWGPSLPRNSEASWSQCGFVFALQVCFLSMVAHRGHRYVKYLSTSDH